MGNMSPDEERNVLLRTVVVLMSRIGIDNITVNIEELQRASRGHKEVDVQMRINYDTEEFSIKLIPVQEKTWIQKILQRDK